LQIHSKTLALTISPSITTKIAIKVYNMISNNGLVEIKKIDGDTYVTITEKLRKIIAGAYLEGRICQHE